MLTRLFSEDSRFYRFMSKLFDLILLNFLWLLTSLPLVTIGASTAALFAVLFKAAKNVLLFASLTLLYIFPMQARYENTVFQTLCKSFLISLRYFGYTFQMIGVILMPLSLFMMIGLMTGTSLSWVICFYVLVGVSSTAYFLIKGPWHLLIQKLETGSETEEEV